MSTADDYSDLILDYYADRSRYGRCARPTHSATRVNEACGDVVRVEITRSPAGIIEQFRFLGDGCCLSQAGAAALAEYMEGRPAAELEAMDAPEMLAIAGSSAISAARKSCWTLAMRAAKAAIHSPLAPAKPAQPVQPAEAVA